MTPLEKRAAIHIMKQTVWDCETENGIERIPFEETYTRAGMVFGEADIENVKFGPFNDTPQHDFFNANPNDFARIVHDKLYSTRQK